MAEAGATTPATASNTASTATASTYTAACATTATASTYTAACATTATASNTASTYTTAFATTTTDILYVIIYDDSFKHSSINNHNHNTHCKPHNTRIPPVGSMGKHIWRILHD